MSTSANPLQSWNATVSTSIAQAPHGSRLANGALVKSLSSNSGYIYVGGPNVSGAGGTGFILLPGENVTLDVENWSQVFYLGVNDADVITGIAL